MPILEIRDIYRSYELNPHALHGVNLRIDAGEILGLIGQNGAGKTTLLRIAIGLLKANRGETEVFGMDPWSQPVEVKRRIGYLPDTQSVPDYLYVQDLINLHRSLFPTWDPLLEDTLARRLEVQKNRRLKDLSKGQVRKALLLCALAHRPDLLVLDEPAGGLDPTARRTFLELSIEMLNDHGSTILFSSHHMTDVERISTRVAILAHGKLIADRSLEDFQENTSIVLMPEISNAQMTTLRTTEDCIAIHRQGASTRAVIQANPTAAEDMVRNLLGLEKASLHCCTTSLEELFVAITGVDQ
jgi:ABC-2 type transport system ATP-binding protein